MLPTARAAAQDAGRLALDLGFPRMFGARFALDCNFGISAETGITYDKIRPSSGLSGATSQSLITPTARVSALVYF
jgi:hypothetical protein